MLFRNFGLIGGIFAPQFNIMKHIFIAASIFFYAGIASSQSVTDTIEMEPGYAKQVFYQIQTGEKHASPMSQWHIAHTTLQMDNSIRLNHAAGVFAFLYPNGDNSAYDNFDTTGWMNWTMPYNDMKDEKLGALNQQVDKGNQWDFSWGVYDPTSHVVKGDSLYLIVVGNGPSAKLYKFMPIKQDKNGDFIFEYGPLDAKAGSPDTIKQSNADMGMFKYYNLNLDAQVNIESANGDWHLNFSRYYDWVPAPGTGDLVMYPTNGVESKRGLKIAQVNGVTFEDILNAPQAFIDIAESDTAIAAGHGFNLGLTRIGSDWKFFNGSSFAIVPRKNYIIAVPTATGTEFWALHFLSFGGQGTGVITLEKSKIGALNNTDKINATKITLYPNPSSEAIWVNAPNQILSSIRVIDMTGRSLSELQCNDNNVEVNISELPIGQYILEAQGNQGISRNLFIKR